MSIPICPSGCSTTLPTTGFNKCDPAVKNGQIAKVYFTKTGYALSDWTSPVEWNSRLDKDSSAADAIRPLIVIGDLPAPTFTEKEISEL